MKKLKFLFVLLCLASFFIGCKQEEESSDYHESKVREPEISLYNLEYIEEGSSIYLEMDISVSGESEYVEYDLDLSQVYGQVEKKFNMKCEFVKGEKHFSIPWVISIENFDLLCLGQHTLNVNIKDHKGNNYAKTIRFNAKDDWKYDTNHHWKVNVDGERVLVKNHEMIANKEATAMGNGEYNWYFKCKYCKYSSLEKAVYRVNYHSFNDVVTKGALPGLSITVDSDDTVERFKCWNTKPDGSGKDYYPGDQMTVNEDIDLYVQIFPNVARSVEEGLQILSTIKENDSIKFECEITKDDIRKIGEAVKTYVSIDMGECTGLTELIYSAVDLSPLAVSGYITNFVVPKCVVKIQGLFDYGNSKVIYSNALETVTLPEGLLEIGDNTFCWCRGLKYIELPSGLLKIGKYAFCGTPELKAISLPDSIIEIGSGAFYSSGLSEINYPEKCEYISSFCFYDTKIKEVKIPASVKYIGENAFRDCENLEKVIFEGAVPPSCEKSSFVCNKIGRKFYIPAEALEAYKTSLVWKDFADLIEGY